MVQKPIQLLQITDLHLVAEADGSVLGVEPFAELARVLDVALRDDPKPDRIVATGDLSEDGSEGSYRLLRDVLLATGLPTYVVPGNHDSAATLKRTLLGGEIRWERVVDVGEWRLVFLDSCVTGMPHGFLADEELRGLSRALKESPTRPVALSLHHGPVSDCPGAGCSLHNAEDLLDVARAHPNLRAILSGHAHVELERRIGHTTVMVTPSTCVHTTHPKLGDPVDCDDLWASHSVDPSRHGYRTVRLMPNGVVETKATWVAPQVGSPS